MPPGIHIRIDILNILWDFMDIIEDGSEFHSLGPIQLMTDNSFSIHGYMDKDNMRRMCSKRWLVRDG